MPGELVKSASVILNYTNELKEIDSQLNLLKKINKLTTSQRDQINKLILRRKELLGNIDINIFNMYKLINPQQSTQLKKEQVQKQVPSILPKPQIVMPKPATIPVTRPDLDQIQAITNFEAEKFLKLSKGEKKKFIKNLGMAPEELKDFIKSQKNKEKNREKVSLVKSDYIIYKPSKVGEAANKFMKSYTDRLIDNYPKFFGLMFGHFKMVEMELLSRTYVSMMLFFTLLAFPGIFLFFLALNFAFKLDIIIILLIAFFGTIFTFFGFYFYPASLIGGKNSKIKLELPFALVHMSAVAGSGAHPLSIFELIAQSDEYPELKKEIRKILNYVNLFGYNLTNALRSVASTTPNPELKELLNGMVSTIGTGGDLKGYLKEKADEALNTYKLERKKQVEALATYSEIYTAILIASPLLLLVTLAIVNSIGGTIGGLSMTTISWLGILGALPLLNVGFMAFISNSQKGL